MTDKILSQDEVDALLKGVASGDIDTEEGEEFKNPDAAVYDFTSQERIIPGKMPGLEMVNDILSRKLNKSISSFIDKNAQIAIQNIDTMKYSDFMRTVPMPSSINIFTLEPLKGYALLVMEAPLVFAFIEFFFGGNNVQYIKSEGREFTEIEQRVIQKIVNITLNDLSSSWKILMPVEHKLAGAEINPQFVTIVTPADIILKIDVDIEIEEFAGKMTFCIPYTMLEPIKEKLYSGIHGDKVVTDTSWAETLKFSLYETKVSMSAELGTMVLPLRDIMNFEIGNIINLDNSVTSDMVVKVEGEPKFRGKPGISRGSQAIQVTGHIE